MRRTKIICTMGPASRDEKTLRQLLNSGMNVARINCSHGSHNEHAETILKFRKVRDELEIPAAVLLDTKGPEIRIGTFIKGKIDLIDGQDFTLTTEDIIGNSFMASVSYKKLPNEVKTGDIVFINDGKVILKVRKTTGNSVICKVIHGGKISDRKGINLPNVDINMQYLSEQDKKDLKFGIEQDVDYVAASFIRSGNDVKDVKKFLHENGGDNIQVIAKIESTQGIDNFEEILCLADGIMVARGDMGVEVAFEKLPGIQKRIIRRCVQSGKIVITATQMLESMITSPVPTRAEITDVANAVFDGTSAIMLSGETAAGQFPVEAVQVMAKIAEQAEADIPRIPGKGMLWHEMDSLDVTNAVGHATCTLAKDICAGAIMAVTKTGYTARRMSKFRPDVIIIGATPDDKTYHQLSLIWGVMPIKANYESDVEELFKNCTKKAIKAGLVKKKNTS